MQPPIGILHGSCSIVVASTVYSDSSTQSLALGCSAGKIAVMCELEANSSHREVLPTPPCESLLRRLQQKNRFGHIALKRC
eukprot:8814057-Karenia_brevis.AAC.1